MIKCIWWYGTLIENDQNIINNSNKIYSGTLPFSNNNKQVSSNILVYNSDGSNNSNNISY